MAQLLARLSHGPGYEDGSDVTNGAGDVVAMGLASFPEEVISEPIVGTPEYIIITARAGLSTVEPSGHFTSSVIRYRVGAGAYVEVLVTDFPTDGSYATRVTAQIPLNPSGNPWSAEDLNTLTLDVGGYFVPDLPGDGGYVQLSELYVDIYGTSGPIIRLGGYTSYDLGFTDANIGASVPPEVEAAIRRGDRRHMEGR